MPGYTVNHAYDAYRDGRRYGPWEDGDAVDLDVADADWVNRDSPGTLTAAKPTKGEAEREAETGANRQARPARNRAGA